MFTSFNSHTYFSIEILLLVVADGMVSHRSISNHRSHAWCCHPFAESQFYLSKKANAHCHMSGAAEQSRKKWREILHTQLVGESHNFKLFRMRRERWHRRRSLSLSILYVNECRAYAWRLTRVVWNTNTGLFHENKLHKIRNRMHHRLVSAPTKC